VREGFKGFPQDWGFVEVRPGAQMFWWLHYTLANVTDYTERPLIIWLQGGPGGSSTAYGNFEIMGPLDLDLNERNETWVNNYNVLYVDNPVGTGFSYVEHNRRLTTNNTQIARDLVELMRGFYQTLPEFEKVPLHIFGQSYGPKMGIEFAYELWKDIEIGSIKSNLTSVGIGNAFISPFDSLLSWAPFLREMASSV
jgi:serine carboxypeptidase 1